MTILELHWRFQKSTNTHNVFALVFCAQSILYTKFHSKTQNDISLVFCKHDCSLQPEQKQKNTFPLYYGTTFTFIMQFLYTKCSIQKSQSSHLDGFCCKKKLFLFIFIMRAHYLLSCSFCKQNVLYKTPPKYGFCCQNAHLSLSLSCEHIYFYHAAAPNLFSRHYF